MHKVIIFALSIGKRLESKVFTKILRNQPNADIATSFRYSDVLLFLE